MFSIRGKNSRLKEVIEDIWERGREIKGAVSLSICTDIPSGPGEVSQGKLVIGRESSSGVQSKSWGEGKGGGEDGLLGRGWQG